ncbi:hypothetical protein R6Q57_019216 [Mikania cordata]
MDSLLSVGSNPVFSLIKIRKNTAPLLFPTCNSLQFSLQFKSQSLKARDFNDLLPLVGLKKRLSKCVSNDGGLATIFDEGRSLENGARTKNLAVFVSGGGSNFRALRQATLKGDVNGSFVVLVTNKHDCGGAHYARENGIPILIYPSTKGEPNGLSSNDLVTGLRSELIIICILGFSLVLTVVNASVMLCSKYKIDFILLAGYLKVIPSELIQAYPNSILNIHPSLLPAFGGKGYYGTKVHKAVIASGARRYSGPTVHFVDENYDTGRILAQRIVPVLANDTVEELAARVLRQEHKLYAEVVAAVCEERVIWREDGVPIIQSKANPNHYS